MARLKITIEGEMSPEEVKRYIVAAWANLPHEVAVSEVDMREPAGTVEVPPPPAPAPLKQAPAIVTYPADPPVEEAAPAPVVEESAAPATRLEILASHKKLSQVLAAIVEMGAAHDLPSVISVCRDMQSQLPILERLGAALEDRVTRTWAGMQ